MYIHVLHMYLHVLHMYRVHIFVFILSLSLTFSHSRDDDDEEEGPVTGLVNTGELLGEKPENMINLPIIKKEEHQVHVHVHV